jgi:hypothetical protein
MTKRLLVFTFAGLLMATSPLAMAASEMEFAVSEQVEEQVEITIDKQTVYITGAQGSTLEVVSLTGRQVMSVKIESPAQRIELNIPKGCYILKVGKVVRKIQVR